MKQKTSKKESSLAAQLHQELEAQQNKSAVDRNQENSKLFPLISDKSNMGTKKEPILKSHSQARLNEGALSQKTGIINNKSPYNATRAWRSVLNIQKKFASTSKNEPTFAGSWSDDLARSRLSEKLTQQLSQLEKKKKELSVLPPLSNYVPDLDEKHFKKLERKAKKIYDKKFDDYKTVFTRAARKIMSVEQLQAIELDENSLKNQFEEARHRNLVSKPIPIKRSTKNFASIMKDDEVLFNQVEGLVENKSRITEYLSNVENLKYSQIPEICATQ